ncbi:MAG: hypothetical protein ACRBF0_12975 [Calditrichia bacterium]
MPKQTYAFEPGGDPRLMIIWRLGWREVVIQLDGHTIGKLDHRSLLEEGREFTLDEGKLHIRLTKEDNRPRLRIALDGTPLKPSSADPNLVLEKTAGALFLFGGGIALLGILASVLQIEPLINQGFTVVTALFGVLFILLGVLVKNNSQHALIAAIGLIAADAAQMLFYAIESGQPPLLSIALRIALIFWLSRGFSAIRELQELMVNGERATGSGER